MDSELFDLFPELVELLAAGLSTAVLSVAGTYVERFAFATIQTGDTTAGAWAAFMGVAMLFLAYVVVTDRLVPTLFEVTGRVTGSPE
ncbi:hypothetical protein [Halomicrobium sp. LC1Hm]|uniref:hypothetical protein n=1 Tax=Halomicrobium sp. LC1Hm TaxID=2610902 RepID=UPI0012982FD4|nr:hypothetical protein [Halomicrobium sp. LC1Hm]